MISIAVRSLIVTVVSCAAVASTTLPQVFIVSRSSDSSGTPDPFASDGYLGSPLPVQPEVISEAGWYRFHTALDYCIACAARTELDPPPADVPVSMHLVIASDRPQQRWLVEARYVFDHVTGEDPAATEWIECQLTDDQVIADRQAMPRPFVWHSSSPFVNQVYTAKLTAPHGPTRLQFRICALEDISSIHDRFNLVANQTTERRVDRASTYDPTAGPSPRSVVVDGWPLWTRSVCGKN